MKRKVYFKHAQQTLRYITVNGYIEISNKSGYGTNKPLLEIAEQYMTGKRSCHY